MLKRLELGAQALHSQLISGLTSQPDYYYLFKQMQAYDEFGVPTKALVDEERPRNIYDAVQKEREKHAKHAYFCGVGIIPVAYLVCVYLICEGLLILMQDPSEWHIVDTVASWEIGFLEFVAWGDIVCACIGIVGIWLGHNIVPGWRKLARMHSFCSNCGIIILLAWRGIVTLMFPPWAGVLLAFTPHGDNRIWLYLALFLYIGFCILMLYIITMGLIRCVHDSRLFQEHLDVQHLHERKKLLTAAHDARQVNQHIDGEDMHEHDVEPDLFGFLPMAETVAVYAVVMAAAMLMSWLHLVVSGSTAGGWAFFSSTAGVTQTYWLEFFIYPICFAAAIVGLLGASSFSGHGVLDEETALTALSTFLIVNMLRFAFDFAITGMNLLEQNTCGFYVNGIAALAYREPHAPKNNALFHCPPMDILLLIAIFAIMIIDCYMIWSTFQLYHHAEGWTIEEDS